MTRSTIRRLAAMALVLATLPMPAFAQASARDVETSTSVGPTAKDAQNPRAKEGGAAPTASERSTATGGNPGGRANKN